MTHEKDLVIKYFDGSLPDICEETQEDIIKAAVLSIETKGRNPRHAKLVELGVVVLELEKDTCKITRVLEQHHWFQDPEEEDPLSEGYTAKTGITQDMVLGKSIEGRVFEEIIEAVDIFVAYNAGYVRPILQEQFPSLDSAVFACVRNQIDWTAKGFGCRSLLHLSKDHNWYNDGLRALDECGTIIKLLQEETVLEEEPMSYFQELVSRAEEPLITIEARVHIRQKYLMKKERFRWDPRERTFLRCMGSSTLERVRRSLDSRGFKGELIERDRLPATERFK